MLLITATILRMDIRLLMGELELNLSLMLIADVAVILFTMLILESMPYLLSYCHAEELEEVTILPLIVSLCPTVNKISKSYEPISMKISGLRGYAPRQKKQTFWRLLEERTMKYAMKPPNFVCPVSLSGWKISHKVIDQFHDILSVDGIRTNENLTNSLK